MEAEAAAAERGDRKTGAGATEVVTGSNTRCVLLPPPAVAVAVAVVEPAPAPAPAPAPELRAALHALRCAETELAVGAAINGCAEAEAEVEVAEAEAEAEAEAAEGESSPAPAPAPAPAAKL